MNGKFIFGKRVLEFLAEGRAKYRLGANYYLSKDNRAALRQRFESAWTNKVYEVHHPTPRKEPAPKKSVREILQELEAANPGAFLPEVVCITPLTEKEKLERGKRATKNLRSISYLMSTKPEPLSDEMLQEEEEPTELAQEEGKNQYEIILCLSVTCNGRFVINFKLFQNS
jgi:hypothetical protein